MCFHGYIRIILLLNNVFRTLCKYSLISFINLIFWSILQYFLKENTTGTLKQNIMLIHESFSQYLGTKLYYWNYRNKSTINISIFYNVHYIVRLL